MGLDGFGTLQIGLEAQIHGAFPDHTQWPGRQGPCSAVSGLRHVVNASIDRGLSWAG